MPAKTKSRPPAAARSRRANSAGESQGFNAIRALAASLHDLHQQMAAQHAPTVRQIILGRSRDSQVIEQTLDGLLNCACSPEGLALFKTLCRYYFPINPTVTTEYVYAYRDLWDHELGQNQKAAAEAKA